MRSLGALGAGLALAASPTSAQTRFAWPDTAVDVARYTNVNQCLAATERVRMAVESNRNLQASPDTMPRDPHEGLKPLPAPALVTAQRCAARWAATRADLTDFVPLFTLYLAAGRDSDASTLFTRRLTAVNPKSQDAERTAVIDSVVEIYMAAHPVRLAAAESLLSARARHTADRVARMRIYYKLMTQATQVRDTARSLRAAQAVVVIGDSLTQADRESQAFGNVGNTILYDALRVAVGERVLLDSLRRSTAAYVGLTRFLWTKATGMRWGAIPMPVGERASPISADYWFPRDSARPPRPTPGHVALVVFFDRTPCVDDRRLQFASDDKQLERGECWLAGAALRRLAERFPTLQITVVAATHGYFMYGPPDPATQEASLIERWTAAHRVPGVLAVTSTSFWHLEAPDDRRVDKAEPNVTHYSFGKSWSADGEGAYALIDRDGVIVDAWANLEDLPEAQLGRLIDILVHRQDGGASNGER
jgi:hypothetical protein